MRGVRSWWHYVRQDEAQFFWKWGRWDYSAGFFVGFGLGFSWSPGQVEATIGPYSVGATRV